MRFPVWWPSRGFLSGVALTAPFLANPLPTWAAALVVLPLLADILLRGVRLRPFFRVTPLVLIVCSLAALHVGALLMGTTPFVADVMYNLIWCGGAVGIVLLASDPEDSPEMMIWGFSTVLVLTATPIAIAGIAKYALQLNGVLFGSLINSCFGRYPQGTTLCGDYNLFGLYLGVAAIGASALMMRLQNKNRWAIFALGVCLAAILVAGLFAGSRRFAALAALVALYWSVGLFSFRRRAIRACVLPLILTACMSWYLAAPRDEIADEATVTVAQVIASWVGSPQSPSPQEIAASRTPPQGTYGPGEVLAARDVSPTALASTFEDNYGFGSRVEKLRLGWQMVQEDGYLLGRGFSYHEAFSCKFVNCEFIDYPHAPILSAWIAFGVIGLAIAVSFYLSIGFNVLLAGKEGILTGASLVALATLPYSLLSGDTIFSLPHTLIGALLVSVAARNATSIFGVRLPWLISRGAT